MGFTSDDPSRPGAGPALSERELFDYLEGRLSPNRQREVAALLEGDPFLRDAVEGLRQMPDLGLARRILADVNARIARRTRPDPARRNWALAAAAVAVLAVSALVLQLGGGDGRELYRTHFTPFPNVVPLMRSGDDGNRLQHAMIAYEAADYRTAAIRLDSLLMREPGNPDARFYRAILDMREGRIEEGVATIRSLGPIAGSRYGEAIEWYLALGDLYSNHRDSLRQRLNGIIRRNSPYEHQARRLLKSIGDD